MIWSFPASLFALVCLVVPTTRAYSECEVMGFSETLMCSDCKKLSEYVDASHPITEECLNCCTPESVQDGSIQYSAAVLSVCS